MKKILIKQPFFAGAMARALVLVFALPAFAVGEGFGPGRVELKIVAGFCQTEVGSGAVWNSRDKLHIQLDPDEGWAVSHYRIDIGGGDDYSPPTSRWGTPRLRFFDYSGYYPAPYDNGSPESENPYLQNLHFDLSEDLDFQWGAPWADLRTQGVAIYLRLVRLDENNHVTQRQLAWVVPASDDPGEGEVIAFPWGFWGWWFRYDLAHPQTGHFIDAHVAGLTLETPTYEGVSDVDGAFNYFPGEEVQISLGSVVLGSTLADQRISPLDLFDASDLDDTRVLNLARLLQSLDVDGDPQGGIIISDPTVGAFEQAMALNGLTTVDFADTELVEDLILDTFYFAGQLEPPVDTLVMQSVEDAAAHLDKTMSNNMYRKNVSKTPVQESAKAKMNVATVWLPARHANDDPVEIEYYDEDVNLIRTTDQAKPLVITYTDADPSTGAHDAWAAVSRDDGSTWKRKNLSRSADRTSFTLENGEEVFGNVKKPVFQVKGNKILVAWSSKFARGGRPGYAIDTEDDYEFDDPYFKDDIWGVGGPQRSFDYTEEDFPEVGEVPFSALWVCRGVIATQNDVNQGIGEFPGDIVWYKPERVTSGRRDVNQIFCGAGSGAGFALVWQEDPVGLRPGHADGPGPGWSGATTSHKTDIWYSYISWGDHSKIDHNFVSGGDPEHDLDVISRPKSLVPMSLPVRLSNNEVINTDNIMVELDANGYPVLDGDGNFIPLPNEDSETETGDSDGTHRYAYEIPGLIDGWYEFYNNQDARKIVAITDEELLLDGDTGASRGNIFLQPYKYVQTNSSGAVVYDDNGDPVMKTSAWVIITYEETKGSGNGPDGVTDEGHNGELYSPDEGKNVIYHSFDLKHPDLVSPGHIMNMPECETITVVDEYGNEKMIAVRDQDGCITPKYLQDEEGNQLLDFQGHPQFAYENARRGRFLLQGVGAIKPNVRTSMLMVYKQGEEGHGRPSDIMMRRWEVPTTDVLVGTVDQPIPDNPYRFENVVGEWVEDTASGKNYWAKGPLNVSSVTPTVTTPSMGDPESDDPYGAVKVVEWVQTEENLLDLSMTNPYDEARAHRGQLRGNLVEFGFTYTSNWAASRNGNDKYDFYIRRSFNGGRDFTTKPESEGGQGVEHCRTWVYPSGTESAGTKVEECTEYGPGAFEAMRNLSHLKNNTESVIEPRIVAVPGTIKAGGQPTGELEDIQDTNVFYVAFGTSTNPRKDPVTGEQDDPEPLDLYYSLSTDKGESYHMETWVVNPDSDGNYGGETVTRWPWMAKGDNQQGEVQLRMTPDGTRFYASWLDEGNGNSDIQFRRLMPRAFPRNVFVPEVPESQPEGRTTENIRNISGGDTD